jgi:argininosuccinate lyase
MAPEKTSTFPAPIYRDTVLAHVFADAQRLFLDVMLEIDYAHLLMLQRQKIVSRDVAVSCLCGLDALDRDALRAAKFDGSVEDLFFLVERKLADACGEENAGRLHTARSRNDLDLTMYRMVLRERLLSVMDASLALRERLIALASEHRASLMPAYTHNQPAQPTTLGHYLMAVIEILERDVERLRGAFVHVNRCPLGACAIATTGFPIDRQQTMHALGFDGLQTNSYGAIAAVDYLTESCSVLAVSVLNLGRFAQDMLLWSTAEFGYLRLSDGYVQISSIMPQKRNPVPLEHVRILASRALSESQAVLTSLHNTPFADMNDAEDSLQPLVDLAFSDGLRVLTLLEGVLAEATFNTERMRQRAGEDFLTVTELADTLVRSTGISFHQAHGFVAAAVKDGRGVFNKDAVVESVLRSLSQAGIQAPAREVLDRAIDPEYFVAVRTIPGGPALEALVPEIERATALLHEDRNWLTQQRDRIHAAQSELRRNVDALLAS